jgi:hypothetical protein
VKDLAINSAIAEFFGPGFSIGAVISGVVLLAATWWFLARDNKRDINEKKVTDKFLMRIAVAFLVATGVFLILLTIQAIGPSAALIIAFIVIFVGALWSAGAEGRKATFAGIIIAAIVFLVIGSSLPTIPDSSPLSQFLHWIGGGLGDVANGLWQRFWNWLNSLF